MGENLCSTIEEMETLSLQLGWAFHRCMEQELEAFNLTFPQYITLRHLADRQTPARFTDLACATRHVLPTLTGIIDRLEARGLVQRQRSAFDRRAWTLSLTPQGHDLLARVQQHRCAWLEQFLQSHSPADQEIIRRGLFLYTQAIFTHLGKHAHETQ